MTDYCLYHRFFSYPSQMKRAFALTPALGIFIFLGIYFYAATLYPGGTKFHAETIGYSHLDNYWCELTDAVTPSGQANPAQIIALWGTVLLPISFIAFWYYIPNLFRGAALRAVIIRTSGIGSMILGSFLPFAHDAVINIAGPAFFVALFVVLASLFQHREFTLFGIALVAIALCLANFLLWRTQTLPEYIPLVQKTAFSTFFIWALLTVRRYYGDL